MLRFERRKLLFFFKITHTDFFVMPTIKYRRHSQYAWKLQFHKSLENELIFPKYFKQYDLKVSWL